MTRPRGGRRGAWGALLLGGGITALLLAIMGSVLSMFGRDGGPQGEPQRAAPPILDGGGRGLVVPPSIAEGAPKGALSWSPGSQPQIADINHDGTEDIVGRTVIGEPGKPGAVYVSAVDGKTFKPFWSDGPYADIEREGHVRFVATADHVAVMDAEGKAHLLDARDGRELLSRPSEKAADVACAAPAPSGMMWLGPSDGKGVLVDAPNRRMMSAPRPEWCPREGDGGAAPVTMMSETRIYAPRDRSLEVLDRATGAKVGRIGP